MKSMVLLFEKQVTKHPDKIAIEYKNLNITYLKLNEEANKFADHLLGLNIKRGDTVALFLSRSIGMMSAIFGIGESRLFAHGLYDLPALFASLAQSVF